MKILMIVFRSSLKSRVQELLQRCEVHAYTEIPETVGLGETGRAEGSSNWSVWPGVNSVIMVALVDDHADHVANEVKAWVEQGSRNKHWAKPPIRVFAWPCAQMV
jgi:nitrogen regulatory protein PII